MCFFAELYDVSSSLLMRVFAALMLPMLPFFVFALLFLQRYFSLQNVQRFSPFSMTFPDLLIIFTMLLPFHFA